MCFGGGGDGGAAQARQDELERQARIKQGTDAVNNNFKQFNPGFFDQRAAAYKAYATPQVQEAFKGNADQLAYSLARSGLTNSSESARQQGVLQRDKALALQQVASGAMTERQKAMQAVEDNRNTLINQVQSTSDPQLAAANALRQANVLTSQSNNFSPLANLFANTTGMLAAANQAGAYSGGPGMGAYKQYFGFGTPSGQNRVVS
jgi:hypothetical protein